MNSFPGRYVVGDEPGYRVIEAKGTAMVVRGRETVAGPEWYVEATRATEAELSVDFGRASRPFLTVQGGHAVIGRLHGSEQIVWSDGVVWSRLSHPDDKIDYVRKSDLEAVLSAAVGTLVEEKATDPIGRLVELLLASRMANGMARPASAPPPPDSNALNMAAFRMGTLKHAPPVIVPLQEHPEEQLPLIMKEVKLHTTAETHEVVFEPVTCHVFVSQMSSSVLVRIPVGADGMLLDSQTAWRVGEVDELSGDGVAGMHSLSLSPSHPGCLWISLQFRNTLLLLDAETLAIRKVIQVPTLLQGEGGLVTRLGGPHCLRECAITGDVWVALKGAVACHPGETETTQNSQGIRRLKAALNRACCSPGTLRQYMAILESQGLDCPPPEGFAVWRLSPDKYNPEAADGAKGGVLFGCLRSPPMLETDLATGDCFVAQDGVETVMHISAGTGTCKQLKIPFPPGCALRITGPGMVRAPDGSIWMTLLGASATLIKIEPRTQRRTMFYFGAVPWVRALRLIHLDFSLAKGSDRQNRIYALASDLLDDDAVNALLVLHMDKEWSSCLGRRVIPLPTQDCSCHRVAVIDAGVRGRARTLVVTEMASSKLLQIKVKNVTKFEPVKETVSDADGFEVRSYEALAEEVGCKC